MIISIASGKGGTGKTTVATNIAKSIKDIQFLDCDVEEPNANIFLKTKIQKQWDVLKDFPQINKKKCSFCGACSEFCEYNAIAVIKSKTLIFPELCHSCGGCELVCPNQAITYHQKPIGRIEYGKQGSLDFYQGLLNIGELQAIPIIQGLKNKIDTNRHVIIYAPPGTSCPVIESISETDYCILVTEPTPFGLYDLKLAVDVVKHLKIPYGVIINRDGIGDTKVNEFCQQMHIPILMRIPHREQIARLYSKGITLVEESFEWEQMFIDLFQKITEQVMISNN